MLSSPGTFPTANKIRRQCATLTLCMARYECCQCDFSSRILFCKENKKSDRQESSPSRVCSCKVHSRSISSNRDIPQSLRCIPSPIFLDVFLMHQRNSLSFDPARACSTGQNTWTLTHLQFKGSVANELPVRGKYCSLQAVGLIILNLDFYSTWRGV